MTRLSHAVSCAVASVWSSEVLEVRRPFGTLRRALGRVPGSHRMFYASEWPLSITKARPCRGVLGVGAKSKSEVAVCAI